MELPRNPIKTYRRKRKISKARDKYRYSLNSFKEKHKAEKQRGDDALMLGLGMYVGGMILSAIFVIPWLFDVGFVAFLISAIGPIFYEFYEKYMLAKYTVITIHIIPKDPDNTRAQKVVVRGAYFGTPLETHEDVIQFIEEQDIPEGKVLLNHAVTAENNGEAKRTIQRAQKWEEDVRVYPVYIRNEELPFLMPFSGDPDEILRPAPEEVSLTSGTGELRHAELYALEAEPTRTIAEIEGEIIDVEIPQFLPFVTQASIEHWLEESEWFIPTQLLAKVAEFTKQIRDEDKTETTFRTMEEERNDWQESYFYLLEHRQVQEKKDEFEQGIIGMLGDFGKDMKKDVGTNIIMFLIGFFICYILFVG